MTRIKFSRIDAGLWYAGTYLGTYSTYNCLIMQTDNGEFLLTGVDAGIGLHLYSVNVKTLTEAKAQAKRWFKEQGVKFYGEVRKRKKRIDKQP